MVLFMPLRQVASQGREESPRVIAQGEMARSWASERTSASEAGGTEVGQRATDCSDIVPNGQMIDVNFEEKILLVKQILELFNRPHCGTVPSLSPQPLNAQT